MAWARKLVSFRGAVIVLLVLIWVELGGIDSVRRAVDSLIWKAQRVGQTQEEPATGPGGGVFYGNFDAANRLAEEPASATRRP